MHAAATPSRAPRVHRVEVRARTDDPRARALVEQAAAIGIPLLRAAIARVYLIEAALTDSQLDIVRERLLADPVTESATLGAAPAPSGAQIVEVHPLPGVMDPAAQSVREALRDLIGTDARVSTGTRYELAAQNGSLGDRAPELARRLLANPVIHAIHEAPYTPAKLPEGRPYRFRLAHVSLRDLSDERLARLSRDAHLFLSPEEMRAIRAEYRRIGREPTDIELETLAQTWSEHCVHKTLKSRILYRPGSADADAISWDGRPGHTLNPDGSVTIDNLLKSTVAAATHELIADGLDWTLSVFKDNAGVIAFDERHAVCVKVETHNHPSAIEPYGGAATGAGGCIRDIIGTGLAARPIASTDVFCVAFPDRDAVPLPPGCLPPRRVLTEIVAGVRDYGNRMGIPTLNGAVYFDDRYIGNPLVFCGCIGVMPRHLVEGRAHAGDRIIALGGRTGRDGIHGATFSSAELEQTHADEFAHAVQIGNPIEEKRLLDAILRARDGADGDAGGAAPLFNAITDCGAGGFSSAIGEMGAALGAQVHLERVPLKYEGLSYTEIWISEAQERMVLAVPPHNLPALGRICDEEGVELADLGHFGTPGRELILHYGDHAVGRVSMDFLHDGIPQPVREASWPSAGRAAPAGAAPRVDVPSALISLLSHPNIASKHSIIRQYDHEVQGNTILKPLVGPALRGPADGAVIEPVPGAGRGLAIACGLQTGIGDVAIGGDPYLMALAAIDECIRNLVCIGADPARIAILDNFCWPSCARPEHLGALVRAAEGCYDGAKAYRTPFVSGKDSLNNQLRYRDPATGEQRTVEIPYTLLITGIGIVPDLARATTMDAKRAGNLLLLVGTTTPELGGSHYAASGAAGGAAPQSGVVPRTDLDLGPRTARAVHSLIASGLAAAAHDVSDGGLLVAIAEMLIASSNSHALGARLDLAAAHADSTIAAFSESPSRYVLEIAERDLARIAAELGDVPHAVVGALDDLARLVWPGAALDEPVDRLARAWLAPLDW